MREKLSRKTKLNLGIEKLFIKNKKQEVYVVTQENGTFHA